MDDLVNMSKDERVGETKECQDIKRVRVSQSQRRKGQAKTQSMKSRFNGKTSYEWWNYPWRVRESTSTLNQTTKCAKKITDAKHTSTTLARRIFRHRQLYEKGSKMSIMCEKKRGGGVDFTQILIIENEMGLVASVTRWQKDNPWWQH